MRVAGTAVLLCVALAIGGCGDGDAANPSGDSAAKPSEQSPEPPQRSKPNVDVPKGPAPKKLVEKDLIEGTGPAAKAGDEVSVHYVLVDYKDGKEVEASWDRGEPFSFQLGSGGVIPGWEEGVVGMKVGGRRELLVPSDLAYGEGALVFMIDLLSIGSPPGTEPKPKIEIPDEPPPDEVVVEDIEQGTGRGVKTGDQIVVNYVGVSYETGKEFEAVWPPQEPTTFGVGTGELIPGWEQGIKGMKAGGRRELRIPSELAFNRGPVIYVVDLLEIKAPAGSKEPTTSATSQPNSAKSRRELEADRPKIRVPKGPPPKQLVVKNLREGSGRAAQPGDRVGILYVGVDYKTGEERYRRWALQPLTFRLGSEDQIPALEESIAGMRVGGRRKLTIPSRLAYLEGAVIYVVELVSID